MLERIFTTSTQGWFDAHPGVAWAIGHPFWALGILLLVVFLFWGLLKAIVRFIEKAWLVILQSPFKLGQWLFKITTQAFKNKDKAASKPVVLEPNTLEPDVPDPTPSDLSTPNPQQRIAEILNRLDAIKYEQDELLQEARAILLSEAESELVD